MARLVRRLSTLPWFVESEASICVGSGNPLKIYPLPEDAPAPLKTLHSQLSVSPYLSLLCITRPTAPPAIPQPPPRWPSGRRRIRGGTFAGESAYEVPGGLWSWLMFAEIKEGTETRGSVEAVVRIVRKTLLSVDPPVALPPNSRKRMHNGWSMIDGGDFAVHVLSRALREKYFEHLSIRN